MISKLFKNLSFRLQLTAVFLSFVGISFGYKTYSHIKDVYGVEASTVFVEDLWLQIFISILANVIVTLIIYQIATKPIKKIGDAMQELVENNTNVKIPYIKQQTEIGSIARKIEVFKLNAIKKKELEAHQAEETVRTAKEKKDMLNNLANTFEYGTEEIIKSVITTSKEMFTASSDLARVIEAMQKQAIDVNTATADASANIQTIASSAEELTSSVSEISNQVDSSTKAINVTIEKTELANDAVETLSIVSTEIGTVITLIQDITEQINLLALNATIEAARAGDAGKGFAVVASEVKSLATQTAKATKEIIDNVNNIQTVTITVSDALRNIQNSVNKANEFSSAIGVAVDEQTKTVNEISTNMQIAAENTTTINNNISKVSEETTQANSTASQVLSSSKAMSAASNNLKTYVEEFLEKIHNAA